MKNGDVKNMLEFMFVHAGVVEEITLDWKEEDICLIKVEWRPWSSIEQEDITDLMLESGQIMDDSCLYRRLRITGTMSTANITLDLGQENWRRGFAKQLSLILAQAIRDAVGKNERHSSSVGGPE